MIGGAGAGLSMLLVLADLPTCSARACVSEDGVRCTVIATRCASEACEDLIWGH